MLLRGDENSMLDPISISPELHHNPGYLAPSFVFSKQHAQKDDFRTEILEPAIPGLQDFWIDE